MSRHHYPDESHGYRVPSAGSEGVPTLPDPIEVVIQLLAAILDSRSAAPTAQSKDPEPMLTVGQAAALLGASRATIIRRADAGDLPCVVVSRGKRQKMRRFPQALIQDLALRAGGNLHTDLKQYTASWLASVVDQSKEHMELTSADSVPRPVAAPGNEPGRPVAR